MPTNYIADRLHLLFFALKVCTVYQNAGRRPIFNVWERIFINQERSQLLQGNEDYKQDHELESLIITTITNNKNMYHYD